MRSLLTTLTPLLLAALAGVATAVQPAVNARFALATGSRVHGGVLNFVVGLFAMLMVALVLRVGVPEGERLNTAPWWSYTGGFMGAFFVSMAIILVPRIGALNYLAAMIAGQLLTSLILDHYGHLGLAVREITPGRLAGLGLVVAGVALVRWG